MTKVRIKQEQIDSCELAVQRELEAFASIQEKVSFVNAELGKGILDSAENALRGFFLILEAFRCCRPHFLKKPQEIDKLQGLAEKLLTFASIQAVTSQNSYLYSVLYDEVSYYKLARGEAWESVVDQMIGDFLGRDGKTPISHEERLLFQAKQSWQLGHLRRARTALHLQELRAHEKEQREAKILLVRIFRVSGEHEEALKHLQIYKQNLDLQDPFLSRIEFQKILIEQTFQGDNKALFQLLNSRQEQLTAIERDTGKLWLFASRQKDSWKSLQKRKAAPTQGIDSLQAHEVLENLISVLEDAYDLEVPLQRRLKLVGSALIQIRHCPDPEWGLVFMAGAIRWLFRSRQVEFASAIIEEYHRLSLSYSEGKHVDVFQLLDDVTKALPVIMDRETGGGEFGQMPTALLPRFFLIARVLSKSGVLSFGHYLRKLSAEEWEKKRRKMEDVLLSELEQSFGQAKGPLMKFAQALASSGGLPEDSVSIMQRVMENAPGIPLKNFEQAFDQSTSPLIRELLNKIEQKPFAVASIGQVHHGYLPDGSHVAVKLMYPKIKDVIAADLKMFKIFRPVLKQIFHRDNIDGFLEDLRQRLDGETNYEYEARNQIVLRELFRDDPEIYIPEVYLEFSNRSLLVSEYIQGERLDLFLQQASQGERNRIARILFRFFTTCTFQHKIAQLDPNISNFIVRGDELVFVDFGAIMPIPDAIAERSKKAYIARYHSDAEYLYSNVFQMISGLPSSEVSLEAFERDYMRCIMPAFQEEAVRPIHNPGERNVVIELIARGYGGKIKGNPREYQLSLCNILYLEVLNRTRAKLNWREELRNVCAHLNIDLDESLKNKKVS